MSESDSDSSVDSEERALVGNERLELESKEDRLSALPDSVIHHILSFLPSTKQIIRTSILSKRWRHQWTRVPVLIFDYFEESSYSKSEDFSSFIDSSLMLYDSSKVKKFELHTNDCVSGHYDRAIGFAVTRNVEEQILIFNSSTYKLPKFLFENSSLVLLEVWGGLLYSDLKVNFKSLKELKIERSKFADGVIENILCGSPVLESLELSNCDGFKQLVISSKSLKRSNLAKLSCLSRIEMQCPKLEELVLCTVDAGTLRLNLPSLIFGTLHLTPLLDESYMDSAKRIIKQFPDVQNLRLAGDFVKPALQVGGLCVPLNCKSLTLHCEMFDMQIPEIKYALCNSPQLEELVIDLQLWPAVLIDLNDYGEKSWHPNGTSYPCLDSHLKTVEIVGLSKWRKKSRVVLPFVEFLLKNARALEKIVVIVEDEGTKFLAEVSQKLLKFPRCSPLCLVDCYAW